MPSSRKDRLFQMLKGGFDQGAAAGREGLKANNDLSQLFAGKQADLEKQTANNDFEAPFKERATQVAEQNARTMEGYRADQARNFDEQRRVDKLKLFFGGGGAAGPDGKPLSGDAQNKSNLVDSAREALNTTETLAQEHPKTAALQAGIQALPFGSNIANSLAGFTGGTFKKINDSKGITKEAMQNVDTGAAATGDQSAMFKNWSGPGVLDILNPSNGGSSEGVRDKLNTMQTGYSRQARTVTPEMLEAAEMEDDPIAQQAMEQQDQRAQAKQQQKLSRMNPQEQQLYQEIKANPAHPNAAKAKLDLERKYGRLF
jgi:hypothetical protein